VGCAIARPGERRASDHSEAHDGHAEESYPDEADRGLRNAHGASTIVDWAGARKTRGGLGLPT
jgi:hypothetical protein